MKSRILAQIVALVPVLFWAGQAVAAPTISWSPGSLEETIETGKDTTFSLSFSVDEDVESLDVRLEVEAILDGLITVSPSSFTGLVGGEVQMIDFTISAPWAWNSASTTAP